MHRARGDLRLGDRVDDLLAAVHAVAAAVDLRVARAVRRRVDHHAPPRVEHHPLERERHLRRPALPDRDRDEVGGQELLSGRPRRGTPRAGVGGRVGGRDPQRDDLAALAHHLDRHPVLDEARAGDPRALELVRLARHLGLEAAVHDGHVDPEQRQLVGDVERRVAAADDDRAPHAREVEARVGLEPLDERGRADHAVAVLPAEAEARVGAQAEPQEDRVVLREQVARGDLPGRPPARRPRRRRGLDVPERQDPLELAERLGTFVL